MPVTEHYRAAVETGDEFDKTTHIVVRDSVIRRGTCYLAIDGATFHRADAIRKYAAALMAAADVLERVQAGAE